jgi:hypothetical protein
MRGVVLTVAQILLILMGLVFLLAAYGLAHMPPMLPCPDCVTSYDFVPLVLLLVLLGIAYLGYALFLFVRRIQGNVSGRMITIAILMVLMPLICLIVSWLFQIFFIQDVPLGTEGRVSLSG